MFSSLSWIIVSMRSHSPRGMAWVCSRLPGFLPHVQIVYALTLSISRREMGAVGDLVRLYTITHLTPGNISCHKEATVFSLHTRLGLSCQWRLHQFSGDWQVYKCPSSIYKKLSLGFAFISRSVTFPVPGAVADRVNILLGSLRITQKI